MSSIPTIPTIPTHSENIIDHYQLEQNDQLEELYNKHILPEEVSVGAIIFNKLNNKYLIIRDKCSKRYGFPKGHIEYDESEFGTLYREIHEETGIDLTKHDFEYIKKSLKQIFIRHHMMSNNINQQYLRVNIFYILIVKMNSNVKLIKQESEIDFLDWVSLTDAKELMKYSNQLPYLYKANNILDKLSC